MTMHQDDTLDDAVPATVSPQPQAPEHTELPAPPHAALPGGADLIFNPATGKYTPMASTEQ